MARVINFIALFVIFFVSYAVAIPVQIHGDNSGLTEAIYTEPELVEALARTYAAMEWNNRNERSQIGNVEERNLDHIGGGNLLRRALGASQRNRKAGIGARNPHIARQSRRSLDSLSGATFGESKRFDPRRKPELSNMNQMDIYNEATKRNIDEIDRAGFDSFSKRNFDEIDRAGWDSFVKRRFIDAYMASRQH